MIVQIIIILFILLISILVLAPFYKINQSNNLKDQTTYNKKYFILPKSFLSSLLLIPIVACWLFFIVSINYLVIDDIWLMIFCCIFTPFFYWWLSKNLGP